METVKKYLYAFAMDIINKTVKEFTADYDSLLLKVTDLPSYSELIKNTHAVNNKMPQIKKVKEEIEYMYKMLKQVNNVFTIQEESNYQKVLKLHENIESKLCFVESNIKELKDTYMIKFEELTDSCVEKTNEITGLINSPELLLIATPINEALHKLNGIKDRLEKLRNKCIRLDYYQEIMKFPDLEKLDAFDTILAKYEEKYNLWSNFDRLTKNRENWFEINIKS